MRQAFFCTVLAVLLSIGCARVKVEAPEEPIKVDVSMRLDIYQHVVKDIDSIESIVSGSPEKSPPGQKNSFLDSLLNPPFVYAQEQLSPDVESAALRRRARYQELRSWQARGVVGENRSGFAEVHKPAEAPQEVKDLVKAENSDRLFIYQSISQNNNLPLEEVQKLYATRLQNDAPAGTPIQVSDEAGSGYQWLIKQ